MRLSRIGWRDDDDIGGGGSGGSGGGGGGGSSGSSRARFGLCYLRQKRPLDEEKNAVMTVEAPGRRRRTRIRRKTRRRRR